MYTGLQMAYSQHSGFWIMPSSASGLGNRASVSSGQAQLLRQNGWGFYLHLPTVGDVPQAQMC